MIFIIPANKICLCPSSWKNCYFVCIKGYFAKVFFDYVLFCFLKKNIFLKKLFLKKFQAKTRRQEPGKE